LNTRIRVISFFVLQPLPDGIRLHIRDVEWVGKRTIVEVGHSSTDYRYFRRDGNVWTLVAQARDQFLVEYYTGGSSANATELFDIPVSFPD